MSVRLGTFLAFVCLNTACSGSGFNSGDGTGGSGAGGNGTGGNSGGTPSLAVVQASTIQLSTEEVPSVTLATAPHPGNAIIVGVTCISDYLGDCVIPEGGVTDDQGNTYGRVVQSEPIPSSAQAARGYIFIAENISGGTAFAIHVNPDGSTLNQSMAWGAIEVSGLASPPSLDAWGISLTGGDVSTTAATDLPTTQASELAVAVLSARSTDTNLLITPEDTWTSHHIHQNNSSGPPAHSMISKVLTSAGIVSHTWTHDAPTRGAAAVIATFKAAR